MSNEPHNVLDSLSREAWIGITLLAATIWGYRDKILVKLGIHADKFLTLKEEAIQESKKFSVEQNYNILEELREGRKQLTTLQNEMITYFKQRIDDLEKNQEECLKREERYVKNEDRYRKENENLRSQHYELEGRRKEQKEILMQQAEVFAKTVMESTSIYKAPFISAEDAKKHLESDGDS